MNIEYKAIAHIVSPFKDKFGIPRQSGICPELNAKIQFENSMENRALSRRIILEATKLSL